MFKRVRLNVRQASRGRQVPWESTSLEEDFIFATGRKAEAESRREREQSFLREREDWDRVNSASADELYAFLRRHPRGAFAEQAQFRLERIAASSVQRQQAPQEPPVLRVTRDRYRVGDVLEYDQSDIYGRVMVRLIKRVTAVRGDQIEINGGAEVWDAMGNLIRDALGRREPPKVVMPSELAMGRSWRTDYVNRYPGGQASVFYDFKVVALEEVDVPAGRIRAYRIEGSGFADDGNYHAQQTDTAWIDPRNFVLVKWRWTRRANGQVDGSSTLALRAAQLVLR